MLELLRANVARFAGVTVRAIGPNAADTRNTDVVAWDALAPDQVGVLRVDFANWADALFALGARREQLRVALVVVRTAEELERAAALLPGHIQHGEPNPVPGARVVKLVRADLVAAPAVDPA